MDLEDLSRRAGDALGLPLVLAAAREPLDPAGLSPGERARLGAFTLARRREEWLRGRAALKSVLRTLGLPGDTSLLAFPHPRLSVTHSAGLAVAVGLAGGPGPDLPGIGIGVDYEALRPMRAGTVRFFLAGPERDALGPYPREADLVRLWTVKEALFKANPGNREGDGRYLAKYLLDGSPAAPAGSARAPDGRPLRYVSSAAWEGMLSVAVAPRP